MSDTTVAIQTATLVFGFAGGWIANLFMQRTLDTIFFYYTHPELRNPKFKGGPNDSYYTNSMRFLAFLYTESPDRGIAPHKWPSLARHFYTITQTTSKLISFFLVSKIWRHFLFNLLIPQDVLQKWADDGYEAIERYLTSTKFLQSKYRNFVDILRSMIDTERGLHKYGMTLSNITTLQPSISKPEDLVSWTDMMKKLVQLSAGVLKGANLIRGRMDIELI